MFICVLLSKDYSNVNRSKMNTTGRKNTRDSWKSRLNIVINELCGKHGVFSTLLNQVNLSEKCLKN